LMKAIRVPDEYWTPLALLSFAMILAIALR
jgi:hypothetical protein